MDLKEKFKKWLDTNPRVQIREVQLEVIADEFAIGFAEWLQDNCWNIESDRYLYEDDQYKTNQLLEIYKKEKGL